jgi:hypothetical protein
MVLNKKIINLSDEKRGLRIGDLLQLCNFCVFTLIVSAFFSNEIENSLYIDRISLVLTLLLCLQTYLVLKLEKKRASPFVLIITFLLIFFYELRIYTLLMLPEENILNRFEYDSSDTNFAIIYIIIFNIFLYFGLFIGKFSVYSIPKCQFNEKKLRFGIIYLLVSLIYNIINPSYSQLIPTFLITIISNFFNTNNILIVVSIYILANSKNIPIKFFYFFVFIIFFTIIIQTLSYSRSAILTIFNLFFLLVLSINPAIEINRKILLRLMYLLPILFTLLFYIYALSTKSRSYMGEYPLHNTISQKIDITIQTIKLQHNDIFSLKGNDNSPYLKKIITNALSRAGFFDFSAEIIAHKEEYKKVFNFDSYFKSFVDNALTPGFNLYDQPRISSTLKFYYGGLTGYDPTIGDDDHHGYHTDQFGIYGEFFSLFNWFSLPIVFIIAVFFNAAYFAKLEIGYIPSILYKFSILYTFFLLINSFGLDWVMWDFFSTLFSLFLVYLILFKINFLSVRCW